MTYKELIAELSDEYPGLTVGKLRQALKDANYESLSSFSENEEVPDTFDPVARQALEEAPPEKTEQERSDDQKLMQWSEAIEIARNVKREQSSIVLIGFQGSGKSTYLYVLGQADYYGIDWGDWQKGVRSPAFKRYIERQEARTALGLDVDKTRLDEAYSFALFPLENTMGSRHLIESLDVSGEVFRKAFEEVDQENVYKDEIKPINMVRQAVAGAGGVILMVDASLAGEPAEPGDDSGRLRQVTKGWTAALENLIKADEFRRAGRLIRLVKRIARLPKYILYKLMQGLYNLLRFVQAFRNVIAQLAARAGNPDKHQAAEHPDPGILASALKWLDRDWSSPPLFLPVVRPIAVVVTKADLDAGQLGLNDVKRAKAADEPSEYKRARARSRNHRQRGAAAFVRKQFRPLHHVLRNYAKNKAYFAVSALGAPPNIVNGQVHINWEKVTPLLVEEPILWLVQQIERGRVYSRVSVAAKTLVFLAVVAFSLLAGLRFGGSQLISLAASKDHPVAALAAYDVVDWFPEKLKPAGLPRLRVEIAEAYERDGDRRLAQEMYSTAVSSYDAALDVLEVSEGAELMERKCARKSLECRLNIAKAAPNLEECQKHAADALAFAHDRMLDDIPVLDILLTAWDETLRDQINTGSRKTLDAFLSHCESFCENHKLRARFLTEQLKPRLRQAYVVTLKQAADRQYARGVELTDAPSQWLFSPDDEEFKDLMTVRTRALAQVAWAELRKGDTAKAETIFREALDGGLNPKDVSASLASVMAKLTEMASLPGTERKHLLAVGNIARMLDDGAQAGAIGELLVSLDLRNARDLIAAGKSNEAAAALDQARKIWPASPELKRLADHLRRLDGMIYVAWDTKDPGKGGFYMDRAEVSVRDYMSFLEYVREHGDKPFRHPREPETSARQDPRTAPEFTDVCPRETCPIAFVSFYDACAYANYAGKRLPSEREWMAAVGRSVYPWGDSILNAGVLTREAGITHTCPPTAPECQNDQTKTGILGLVGNVSEWTSDVKDGLAVVKGRNWLYSQAGMNEPMKKDRRTGFKYIGFRCVIDALPIRAAGSGGTQHEARK